MRDGPNGNAIFGGEGDCVAELQWDLPWRQLKRVVLEQAYQCDLGLLQISIHALYLWTKGSKGKKDLVIDS